MDADADRAALEGFDAALLEDDPVGLYERAPCGYLSTAPDGTIVKVNQTFLRWTGYTAEELVGHRRFAELLTAGGRMYHETHYAPMLQMQGRARQIAVDIVCADGRRLPTLVNAVLERDGDGEPLVVRTAVFDATDRRGYEQELLRAKQAAEESEARAHRLAETLQQTLIPPDLPEIAGLELAAVYRPAGRGDEVGGDFYDVFQTDPDTWFVVIGDVCGKGADAAVVTAFARYTIRAVAVNERRPADMLAAVNELMLRDDLGRFCTVALLRLERGAASWHSVLSVAGHPPPYQVPTSEPVRLVGEPAAPLGLYRGERYHDVAVDLAPGDGWLLYTDGVTEARRDSDLFGEERTAVAVSAHRETARSVVNGLFAEVEEFQGPTPRDDIAIVGVRVLAPAR
jgi:sigma-B regulation protein RsbU (phosphoserine phosphatase)